MPVSSTANYVLFSTGHLDTHSVSIHVPFERNEIYTTRSLIAFETTVGMDVEKL